MVAVDEAKVQSAKDEVASAVDHIQRVLQDVQELVDSGKKGFVGAAGAAYVGAASAWDEEAVRLKGVLIKLEAQVGEGQTTYAKMEAVNEEGFARLTNL
ncbi:WXG100 family type VII secretion target [Nocardia sp. NPDC058666]|uniref:WXG100 family type VII secretion target n=1 Tax=unclassified Nocardia TaxID=2637762 RepID=UPI00364C1487